MAVGVPLLEQICNLFHTNQLSYSLLLFEMVIKNIALLFFKKDICILQKLRNPATHTYATPGFPAKF